jgi:hypothetical protein
VQDAIQDPDIVNRIVRGERFTTGRSYMDVQLQVEIHPLVNFYIGLINNLMDGSGIIQPRAVWDPMQNIQVIIGYNVYYGELGTEFGGIEIPATSFALSSPDMLYAWISFYF